MRHAIQQFAQKRGKAVGWSAVVLSLLTLLGGLGAQHVQSDAGRAAVWARIGDDEKQNAVLILRIEALEKAAAYQQGINDEKHILDNEK